MSYVSEYLIGSLGPYKRLGILVGEVQIVVNGILKLVSALMHATPQLLFGKQCEPALHEIQPRGLVGVKCVWKRGLFANQLRMRAVL